ncbi:hypothetical protein OsJ_23043 [Oryza sativa Japonica Group]|uniref:Uncharacterized protein n=1 Tax=Oryza sativa subsp. japonica TaxID=39947 RepID=B9FVF4_ORYSJ|nr:hypothetical protein OsJ_23043 [Oryza sativa Japonica Group]
MAAPCSSSSSSPSQRQVQQEYEVTSSSSSLPSRRGAGEGHQQLPWAQQEYEVTSAATAGPCDAYLVFRSSPPLYASAVSIFNLLNVTATPGDEVVRGGDGGAPKLEEERAGAL